MTKRARVTGTEMARETPKTPTVRMMREKYASKCLYGLILDVGCYDTLLQRFVKSPYVGVDVNREFLRKGYGNRICSNLEFLPFKDSVFDSVACLETLEHVKNPDEALAEIRGVLKRSGLLVFNVPNPDNLVYRLKRLIGLKATTLDNERIHVNEWKWHQMKALLKKRRFKCLPIKCGVTQIPPRRIWNILRLNEKVSSLLNELLPLSVQDKIMFLAKRAE